MSNLRAGKFEVDEALQILEVVALLHPRFDVADEDQISLGIEVLLRRVVLRCAPCKHLRTCIVCSHTRA